MANPTTNFGWVMPTSTDLVTDLPADFNTFGQGVDTTLAELKGGTTGQVLSKTSNTDMDFTWIANDVGDITGVTAGTGISGGGTSGTVTVTNDMATTITTAGDLIKGTGAGTYSRLGIGTTSQVLTVVAGAPAWATPAGGTTFVGCSLYKTVNQSVATATDVSILFDGEHYDTDGFHSTSANTERITIPTGKSGYYAIAAKLSYSSNTSGIRQCPVYINGLSVGSGADVRGSMTGDNTPQFVLFRYLTAADYIFISAYQNSGATLNVQGTGNNYSYSYLQVAYLGA